MLKLRFSSGSLTGSEVEVHPPGALIGRDPDTVHIVLTDKGVSANHAQLESKDGKSWHLRDCGSRNGTLLNDQPVGTQPVTLPLRGQISFADIEATYHIEPSTSPGRRQALDPVDEPAPPTVVSTFYDSNNQGASRRTQNIAELDQTEGRDIRRMSTQGIRDHREVAQASDVAAVGEESLRLKRERDALQAECSQLRDQLAGTSFQLRAAQDELERLRRRSGQHGTAQTTGNNAEAPSAVQRPAVSSGEVQTLINQAVTYIDAFSGSLHALSETLSKHGPEQANEQLMEVSSRLFELRLLLEDGRRLGE